MSAHGSNNLGSGHSRFWAWAVFLLTIISFGFGFYAYRVTAGIPVAAATYRSLQLFHLHFHDLQEAAYHDNHGDRVKDHPTVVTPDPLAGAESSAHPMPASTKPTVPAVTWQLNVARFGSAFVCLGLIPLILTLRLFGEDLRKGFIFRFWSDHVIVSGHSQRTLSLVRELAAHRRKVIFIGDCAGHDTGVPSSVFHLPGDARNEALLSQAVVHKAKALIALNEDDRTNLEILVLAERLCTQRKLPVPLSCHAHVQDSHLKTGLHRQFTAGNAPGRKVAFHLFNYYEVAARRLACQYPIPESVVEQTPLPEHYVIVGFGSFGQNVALKLVKMGQQLVKQSDGQYAVVRPRVTVIDNRGEEAAAAFLHAHPRFSTLCDWRLEPLACTAAAFLDLAFLKPTDAPAKTSVIFCLDNESVSLPIAMLLRDVCRDAQNAKDVDAIYVRLADPARLEPVVKHLREGTGKPMLQFFAPDSEIFSTAAILKESHDEVARFLHEMYLAVALQDQRPNNNNSGALQHWDYLPEEYRNSSREAADHIWAKLRTIGYVLNPTAEDSSLRTDPKLLAELEAHQEELARAEHYRWITEKLLDGWTLGAPRTTDAEIAEGKPKRHPDLVPYETLDETTKEKDRVNIRAIRSLIQAGKLEVVKQV